MKSNKKTTLIRILIFLILSFVPVYIIGIFGITKDLQSKTVFGSATMMYYPAIAVFLTRIITKEGMTDSKLKINFKGNKKYYLLSLLLPLVTGLIFGIIAIAFFVKDYSFSEAIKQNGGYKTSVTLVVSSLYAVTTSFLLGFGEELGWRGYLTPQLEKLMPRSCAVIICGIIWGLWHAPLIVKGYNFGRDYSMFPYLGVIMMCAGCILISFFMSWLTWKTDSVYPAAIFHTASDIVSLPFAISFLGAGNFAEISSFKTGVIMIVAAPAVIALGILVSSLIAKGSPEKS